MIEIFSLAQEIETVCEEQQWKFCFIGGLALQRWGEPRVTHDVDLIVLTSFEGEEGFVDRLLKSFQPRRSDAREFAMENRVLLLESAAGIGIDISLAGLPFEEKIIEHSSICEFFSGIAVRTCSAEDLIVMKSFAARMRDWGDVETIVARQKGKLDWTYIFEELTALAELKEEPEIVDQLRSIKDRKKA